MRFIKAQLTPIVIALLALNFFVFSSIIVSVLAQQTVIGTVMEDAFLRSSPSLTGDVISRVDAGTQVVILDTVTGEFVTSFGNTSRQWFHVELPTNTRGYIWSGLVEQGIDEITFTERLSSEPELSLDSPNMVKPGHNFEITLHIGGGEIDGSSYCISVDFSVPDGYRLLSGTSHYFDSSPVERSFVVAAPKDRGVTGTIEAYVTWSSSANCGGTIQDKTVRATLTVPHLWRVRIEVNTCMNSMGPIAPSMISESGEGVSVNRVPGSPFLFEAFVIPIQQEYTISASYTCY